MSEKLNRTVPTINYHLNILRNKGLAFSSKVKKRVNNYNLIYNKWYVKN